MSKDLEYEYQIPTRVDDGDAWGAILEHAIERLVTHSHNGIDSAPLTTSITKNTTAVSSALWADITTIDGTKDGREVTVSAYENTTAATNHVRDFFLVTGTITTTVDGDGLTTYGVSGVSERIKINPTVKWATVGTGEPDTMTVQISSELDSTGTPMHLLIETY